MRLPSLLPPDIDRHQDAAEQYHPDQRLVGVLHDQILVLADGVADPGQDGTPDAGAGQGVERELEMVHAGKPGRYRDEMAHNRQQSADECRYLAVLQKKVLHALELVRRDQYIPAVFEDQRPSQVVGDEVVGIGPDQAADCSAQYGDRHAHLALVGQIAGRRHDQFAWNRDDRTFHGHQQDDAGIAHGADGIQQPLNKCMH